MDSSTIIIIFMGTINTLLLVALIYVVTRPTPFSHYQPMMTPMPTPRQNVISSFPPPNLYNL